MIASFIGIVFILVGGWGILEWFPDLLIVARGFLPLSLLLGGVVAVMAGVSSLQKPRNNEKQKS